MRALKTISMALLLAAGGFAQTPAQERGKEIVDEALAALGGGKYLHMLDRTVTGRAYSFFRERLTGLSIAKIHTRYLTRPEPPTMEFFGMRERQILGKKQEVSIVFTETDSYEVNFRGATPLPEDRVKSYREAARRSILYILRQRLGEAGMIFEYKASEIFENVPVEVVDVVDADNVVITVYFSKLAKWPVRQVYYNRDPLTKERIDEVTRFNKYRDVSGVEWPFQIVRERNGEKVSEIFAESVTINSGLTDNLFTLPANVKILKKGK